ncbi:MAG: biotin--[Victivallales bacterium]|nr:biotin--[acetyl-CoA-carboxylase] ligase [Victivallales bacterium]
MFNDDINQSLRDNLATESLGRALLVEEVLESTNLTASEMAGMGMPHGLVVVADRQTGGRGRNGRAWLSPAGVNLYFSMLLRPSCPPGIVPQIAILTALAERRALGQLLPSLEIQVKWPNDVLVKGGKLSGILCSMSCQGTRTDYAIVGVGINVNALAADFAPDVRSKATSLWLLTGRCFPRGKVLALFLNQFEPLYRKWLKAASLSPFLAEWRKASVLEGKQVTVEQGNAPVTGVVDGITADGQLILRDGQRTSLATAGDAHVVG